MYVLDFETKFLIVYRADACFNRFCNRGLGYWISVELVTQA